MDENSTVVLKECSADVMSCKFLAPDTFGANTLRTRPEV